MTLFRKRDWSLRAQMLLSLSVLMLAVLLLVGGAALELTRRFLAGDLIENGRFLAANLAELSSYGVATGNILKDLDPVVAKMAGAKDATYLAVLNDKGRVLVSAGSAPARPIPPPPAGACASPEGYSRRIERDYEFCHPVNAPRNLPSLKAPGDGPIGTTRIVVSPRRMHLRILRIGATMALILTLLLLVGFLFAFRFIERLTRRLEMILEAFHVIQQGRLGVQVPVSSHDEIGKLASGFNRMSLALAAAISDRDLERKRLANIVQRMADILIVVDPGGRVDIVNLAAETSLGYGGSELRGLPVASLFETADTQEESRISLADVIRGASARNVEAVMRAKDGRGIAVLVSSATLPAGNVGTEGVILVAKDLTERKKLEAMLRHSEKLSVIGRLAGGVAHDFNNILNAIIGYSYFLLENLPKEEQNHKDVQEIRNAADRAVALTRQLLAFSRRQVLQPTVQDINASISVLETMLRRLLPENIVLSVILSPTPKKVKIDVSQIEQALLNLVINARDVLQDGGMITIRTLDRDLKKTYSHSHGDIPPGHYVVIEVEDTGAGMSAEIQSHLFEPFFTTKEKGKGTGLGLAMVQGIVLQSGGYIIVDSAPGRGSIFKIHLPLSTEAVVVKPAAADTSNVLLRGDETILLVEDDPAALGVTRRSLTDAGYRVLVADRPSAAIQICERGGEPINLLLTDILMPEMNGVVLAQRLLSMRPGLIVVYMSGYSDPSILRTLAADADFIQKPYTPSELAKRVRQALDRRR